MSPEILGQLIAAMLGGGGLGVAIVKWFSNRDMAKLKSDNDARMAKLGNEFESIKANLKIESGNDETLKSLIDVIAESNKNNTKLIASIGDTERTHREVAQAHTTALEGQTKQLGLFEEAIAMSTSSNVGKFDEMLDILKKTTAQLARIEATANNTNDEQRDKLEEIVSNLLIVSERLESASQHVISVPNEDVAQTSTHEDLTSEQTAKTADNQKKDKE